MTHKSFQRFSAGVLLLNLGVILWGAFVRATGSGAGCGDHWPTCNGELVPRAAGTATLIEFTHRATSGLALLATFALVAFAFRAFAAGHPARRASVWVLAFMLSEAAVGAGLVKFELVADNASIARAWVMCVHLVNTFALLAANTWAVYAADQREPLRFRLRGDFGVLLLSLLSLLVLGASGAITALGDTLFPAGTSLAALPADRSMIAALFYQLRILHPLLAVGVGAFTMLSLHWLSRRSADGGLVRAAWVVSGFYGAQLLIGVANVLLAAPVAIQLLHLLIADLVWIAYVYCAARLMTAYAQEEKPEVVSVHPRLV